MFYDHFLRKGEKRKRTEKRLKRNTITHILTSHTLIIIEWIKLRMSETHNVPVFLTSTIRSMTTYNWREEAHWTTIAFLSKFFLGFILSSHTQRSLFIYPLSLFFAINSFRKAPVLSFGLVHVPKSNSVFVLSPILVDREYSQRRFRWHRNND
jgi:hypothetical protein